MTNLININTASAEIIASLPSIGATLAERIVAYRNEVRPFAEPIELVAVNGISVHMVQEIAPLITVADRDTTTAPITLPPLPPPTAADDAVSTADSVLIEEEVSDVVEPVMAVSSAAASPPRPTPPPTTVAFNWRQIGVGALLGMVLTLVALAILNGGALSYSSRGQMDGLQTQLETVVVQQATLQKGVERARADSADSRNTILTVESAIDDNLEAVFEASEGIVIFLEGMENVVGTLNPDPIVLPTEFSEEPAPTSTPRPTQTPTVNPTARRTTRPTATPIGTPEN